MRSDDWTTSLTKWSFRLYFRGMYGQDELEYPLFDPPGPNRFNVLAIRTNGEDPGNPFITERLVFNLHSDMGALSLRGTFVNFFVNGEFKTYYHLLERPDEAFFKNTFDSDNDWDVLKRQVDAEIILEAVSGDKEKWNEMLDYATSHDLSDYTNYIAVSGYLDIVNFIDFILINVYASNRDWPGNNWIAARERVEGAKYGFYCWDVDYTFHEWLNGPGVTSDTIGLMLESSQWGWSSVNILHQELKASPEYRLLWMDRVQKHFFSESGALRQTHILERLHELRDTIQPMISYQFGETFDHFIEQTWIPQRQDIILGHMLDTDLWTTLLAPQINTPGAPVPAGFSLTMSNPNGEQGTVYYTQDGSDPREAGTENVSSTSSAYLNPIYINFTTMVKARVLNDQWSPLSEGLIEIEQAPLSPGSLIITEFLANANGNDDNKEWFEVFNTTNEPIDLNGWVISDNDNDTHTINNESALHVPAKGYLVLGESTDPSLNGGAPIDYAYGPNDVTFSSEGDEIILSQNGTVIHAIGYGDFKNSPTQVMDVGLDAVAGLALGMAVDYCTGAVTSWQPQVSLFGTNGDTGTPGADNDGVDVCSPDTTPPELSDGKFARRDLIWLKFNEPLEHISAEATSNYTLDHGVGIPSSASLEAQNIVLLQFSDPASSNVDYTISIAGVKDEQGNPIVIPEQGTLSFKIPAISITELMYDNNGSDIEWIELYNTTGAQVDLSDWYLSHDDVYPAQGEGNATLPPGTIIQPGQYLIVNLWDNPEFSRWQMPRNITVVDATANELGALSNGGDNLALYNLPTNGTLIDGSLSVAFPDLAGDGASLEKIDELMPWGDEDNVQYNFRRATVHIGFQTDLGDNGEPLGYFASPGRHNGTDRPLTSGIHWIVY